MDQGSDQSVAALLRLVNGYRTTQAIHVAAKLGIADLLAAGPRTSDDLADATACHAPSLYRLLRALAAIDILHEEGGHVFSLAPLGEWLRSDIPESVAGWAAFIGEPYHWQAWGDMLHSVQTGETGFDHVHGTDPWTFRAQRPELSAGFDRAMSSLSRQLVASVLAAYDFGRFATVVDIGGGNGALLAAILSRYPAMRGVLFDQPHVVAGAAPLLQQAGVADRCEVVGGSFFEAVPSGGDAYILKSIIHDWDDERSVEILKVCRRAMTDDAALLLVERDLGPANARPDAKFSDLNMLAATGGRERSAEEYAALYAASGFRFVDVTRGDRGTSVFEGKAA